MVGDSGPEVGERSETPVGGGAAEESRTDS